MAKIETAQALNAYRDNRNNFVQHTLYEVIRTEKNNKAKPSVTAGIAVEDVDLEGIPDGFPTDAVPIYENPEIIDSSTFGEDGYSITYSVNDVYDNVVGFYMTNIEGLDESGIGDDESYFEGIDVGDVHINGITITDNGNKTTVFITLRNYKSGSDNNIEENDEDVGEADSSLITYANAKEEKLDKKYPSDVVPIFPKAKVIGCSLVITSYSIHYTKLYEKRVLRMQLKRQLKA